MPFDRARLAEAVDVAEADLRRLRLENGQLAQDFRAEPTDDLREQLKRGATSLASARDRVDTAKAALAVFDKTGSPHGLVADSGRIMGTIAVPIAPGTTRPAREAAIEEALEQALADAVAELGVVLAAAPARYAREQPGRDDEGRTVFEVAGRVEGDRLVPATSKGAKNLRN